MKWRAVMRDLREIVPYSNRCSGPLQVITFTAMEDTSPSEAQAQSLPTELLIYLYVVLQ